MRTGKFLTGVLRGALDLQSPEGVIEASSISVLFYLIFNNTKNKIFSERSNSRRRV